MSMWTNAITQDFGAAMKLYKHQLIMVSPTASPGFLRIGARNWTKIVYV